MWRFHGYQPNGTTATQGSNWLHLTRDTLYTRVNCIHTHTLRITNLSRAAGRSGNDEFNWEKRFARVLSRPPAQSLFTRTRVWSPPPLVAAENIRVHACASPRPRSPRKFQFPRDKLHFTANLPLARLVRRRKPDASTRHQPHQVVITVDKSNFKPSSIQYYYEIISIGSK